MSLLEDIYLFNNPITYALLIISVAVSLVMIFYYVRLIIYMFIGADGSGKAAVNEALYSVGF
jgi:NADH:ubiquinone oxidoreductase subunit 2 (subunit N)